MTNKILQPKNRKFFYIALAFIIGAAGLSVFIFYHFARASCAQPCVAVNPLSLTFTAVQGGPNPPSQTINLTEGKASNCVTWGTLITAPWLTLTPLSGTRCNPPNGILPVSVDITGLTQGAYTGIIRVYDPGYYDFSYPPPPAPISVFNLDAAQDVSVTVNVSPPLSCTGAPPYTVNCQSGNKPLGQACILGPTCFGTGTGATPAAAQFSCTASLGVCLAGDLACNIKYTSCTGVVSGSCGTANGKTYLSTDTGWGADTFCSVGTANPASPAFPPSPGSTSWNCDGSGGGTTASCSASRAPPPPAISVSPGSISVCNAAPSGTIRVNSENMKKGTPVASSWLFPALPTPVDPCTATGSPGCISLSSATYNSVPVPNGIDIYTLQATPFSAGPNYSLGGVRKEIVFAPPQLPDFSLVDTLKNFFASVARAQSVQNCSPFLDPLCVPSKSAIFSQPLSSAGTAIFFIDWYPEAQIQVSPSPAALTDTSPGSVSISNIGAPGSSMNWNVLSIAYTSGSNWLNVSPGSGGPIAQGGSPQTATLSYNTAAGLLPATYNAVVSFFASSTAPGARLSKQDVPVTLTVSTPAVSCSPDGQWINTAANGGSITLHASGGTGSYSWTAAGGTPPSGGPGSNFTVNYAAPGTYTVGVTSPLGKPTSCTVNVLDLSCTFSANPTKLIAPQSSQLSWTCRNANSCDITSDKGNSFPGVNPVTGNLIVTPTSTTNYYLNCKGGLTGTVTYSTTVNVEVKKPSIKEP